MEANTRGYATGAKTRRGSREDKKSTFAGAIVLPCMENHGLPPFRIAKKALMQADTNKRLDSGRERAT
jgi:hypothetical protein